MISINTNYGGLFAGKAVTEAQKEIDAADAQRPLIRLLKMWAIEVKEQGMHIIFVTYNRRVPIVWKRLKMLMIISPVVSGGPIVIY